MNPKSVVMLCLALVLVACVPPYQLIGPGDTTVEGMRVSIGGNWNKASPMLTPYARKTAQVWTRDGLLLDRLMIIPAVPDGETVFVSKEKDAALPRFRADMLPHELSELVESSIVKIFGEGEVSVSIGGLRPQRFGERDGAFFELRASVNDGPDYEGFAGGFVGGEELYLIIFLGAQPYYAEKNRDAALAVMQSARLL